MVYSDLLSMFVSEDVTQKEKACNILLGYAKYVTSLFRCLDA